MKSILCINDHIADLSEQQTEELIYSLPLWRRETALRYKHLQGRRECAVGYIELFRGLKQGFGLNTCPSFVYNEHGKPFLKEYPNLFFSISHCKEAVGSFIADRPCGLDIEFIRKAKPDLVRHTMSPQESEEIFSSKWPDIAFTRLWTQKEAVLKLIGTGITDDLHSVLEPEKMMNIRLQTTENPYRNYIISTAIQV